MADIGSRNWLVSPTKEIDDMWVQVQIQEKKSRIARHKQDIEDLMKGRLTELNATILMLELEIKKLETSKITDIIPDQ